MFLKVCNDNFTKFIANSNIIYFDIKNKQQVQNYGNGINIVKIIEKSRIYGYFIIDIKYLSNDYRSKNLTELLEECFNLQDLNIQYFKMLEDYNERDNIKILRRKKYKSLFNDNDYFEL